MGELACPNAKLKYRTKFQMMMNSFGLHEQSAHEQHQGPASLNEPTTPGGPQRSIDNKRTTLVKIAPEAPEAHCVVCLADSSERSIDWVFEGCGHRCLCKPCVRKLHDKAASHLIECPLCRSVSNVVP